jgi:hypothetical protein
VHRWHTPDFGLPSPHTSFDATDSCHEPYSPFDWVRTLQSHPSCGGHRLTHRTRTSLNVIRHVPDPPPYDGYGTWVRTDLTTSPNAGWTRTPRSVSNPTTGTNALWCIGPKLSAAPARRRRTDSLRRQTATILPDGTGKRHFCGGRPGWLNDQPKLGRAIPCGCPASRQANRGRPLTAPRRTWVTIQGPATSGLHVPPHDVVSLQVSLFLLHTALLGRAP